MFPETVAFRIGLVPALSASDYRACQGDLHTTFFIGIPDHMKRFSFVCALIISGILLAGANGCSSDPNVEGAKLDLRNQDYDRALENVDTALENNPENADALELRGRILQEKAAQTADLDEHSRLIREMLESYERAVEVNPDMESIIEQRLRLAWVEEFQNGIEAFNQGQSDQSAYLRAAKHFENTVLIEPDSTGGYINQAYALINADRESEAIAPLEEAIARGDNSPEIYIRTASLYGATGQHDEAVRVLREAREANPADMDIQAQLLNAYVMADRLDEAMTDYENLVVQDPSNKYYRYNYGSLLLEAESYDEAIEHLREAVRIDPHYPAAQFNLGAAFINRAVDLRDVINEMDDELRAQRPSLSREEITQRENAIDALVDEQHSYFEQAIEPLERALDLSSGARFEVTGDPGTRFTGSVSGTSARAGDDVARSVDGLVPAEFYVGGGNVSGTFTREGEEGELQARLVVGFEEVASATTGPGEATVTVSENVGNVGFVGTNVDAICQALFSAYIQTNQQEKAEVISDCAGYGDM